MRKNSFQNFHFLILIFFVALNTSCKSDKVKDEELNPATFSEKRQIGELIVGSWQGKDLILSPEMISALPPDWQLAFEAEVDIIRKTIAKTRMEFGKDLFYNVFAFDRREDFGRYQIRNDGKDILLTTEDKNTYSPFNSMANIDEATEVIAKSRKNIFRIIELNEHTFSYSAEFIEPVNNTKIDIGFQFERIE